MKTTRKIYLLMLNVFLINAFHSNAVIVRHDKSISAYTDLAQQPRFDCVGYFYNNMDSLLEQGATFVIISNRYLLTAAHNFILSDYQEKNYQLPDGRTLTVNDPINHRIDTIDKFTFVLCDQKLSGKRLIIHPQYFDGTSTNTHYDLALIELSRPLTNYPKLPSIYTGSSELKRESIFVGFGSYGIGSELRTEMKSKKLAGINIIDTLESAGDNNIPTKILIDFDDPERIVPNQLGEDKCLDLEFGTSGGDSGGPLFIEDEDGRLMLVGILSGGGLSSINLELNRYYGNVSYWTRVSTFADWIKSIITE